MTTIQIKAEDVQSGDVIVEKHPTGGTTTRWPVDSVYPTSVIPAGDIDGNDGKTEVTAVLTFPSGAKREVSFLADDPLTVERTA